MAVFQSTSVYDERTWAIHVQAVMGQKSVLGVVAVRELN